MLFLHLTSPLRSSKLSLSPLALQTHILEGFGKFSQVTVLTIVYCANMDDIAHVPDKAAMFSPLDEV